MSTLTKKSVYQADVKTTASGTEIIGSPCVVYEITMMNDAKGDATLNISNSTTSYSSAYRLVKLLATDENQMVQVTFPGGKPFSNGLSATCNKASTDISVTYE